MAKSCIVITCFITSLLSCHSLAAARPQAPPPGAPPVDQAEGGNEPVGAPMRIGSAVLSGSVFLEGSRTTGDTEDETRDMLRVRRARIGLAGTLSPRIGWSLSAELTAEPALRNAFVVVKISDHANLRIGQANPITALERGLSALSLELIDRSPATSELTGPADLGVTLFSPAPYRGWLGYALNISNGAGFNRPDDNDSKDVSGRIAVSPPSVEGLLVVASGARGQQPGGLRTRAGLGAEYKRPSWRVVVEGLRQVRDRLPASNGYVVMAAVRPRGATVPARLRQLEFAARFSVLNDHATAAGVPSGIVNDDGTDAPLVEPGIATTREFQAGANVYVNSNLRVMADLVVPVDERKHPGPAALMRLQLQF